MYQKNGYLKKYFQGAAVKRLSEEELIPTSSDQLEITATAELAKLLGSGAAFNQDTTSN